MIAWALVGIIAASLVAAALILFDAELHDGA